MSLMLILQNGVLFVPVRGIGLQWEFFCIRKKSSSRDLSAAVRDRARDSNQIRKVEPVNKEEITKCTLLFQEV